MKSTKEATASKPKSTKNYIKGSAKTYTFKNGGEVIHVDLKMEELQKLPVNKAGYIKLTLSKLASTDDYGNNYSIFENDWKPADGESVKQKAPATPIKPRPKDDLPF